MPAFADPREDARTAQLFWHPVSGARTLTARIDSANRRGPGGITRLADWPCSKALLKLPARGQQLSLAGPNGGLQLECIGGDVRSAPFRIAPIAVGFPRMSQSLGQMALLERLVTVAPRVGGAREWTVAARRHRDALAALDLRRDGLSYRQIAMALYGENAVARDWNAPDQTMKNRLIRSVKRGHAMMNGGYSKLLPA